MPDREKVIRQWEGIIDQIKQGNMRRPIAITLIYDTFALLTREQEALEPIKKPGIVTPYRCGACKTVLGWETEKQKFCPNCGRKVKWDA